MKPGTYRVSFLVDLNDYTSNEESVRYFGVRWK